MKIAFIAYLHGFGGAQRQIINVANAMRRKGHRVVLISLSGNRDCYGVDPTVKKYYVRDCGVGLLKIINRYRGLKKLLRKNKPDVVVNFWFQSTYLTAFMKRKMRYKIVYSERSDPNDKQYHGLLGVIRKLILGKIDGFVFQTNAAKEFFNEDVQRRSVIIPNAVSVHLQRRNNLKKEKKIVTVGRLHEQKNMPLLIRSFAEISGKFPEYRLHIYGDGELRVQLQNMVNEMGLKNKVCLCGATEDVHDKIVDAEIFVLSSNYEGMPNALLEAMRLGLPCISTDWKPGGIIDIIKNGDDGIVVPCDNVKELSSAMARLINDKQLMKRLSRNALNSSKRYDPEVIYSLWDVYLKNTKGGIKGE